MLSLIWIALGLAGLMLGSEIAVRSTVQVADRRGLSQGFLGVTVLAIGTDLPELLVAVTGGLRQLDGVEASGVVVGNAVGSALAQGSLVLGIAGLIGHLHMSARSLRRDGTVLLLSTVLLGSIAASGSVSRVSGGALLLAYAVYTWMLGVQEQRRPDEPREPWSRLTFHLAGIAVGLVVVLLSAGLVVDQALALAEARGWDQTLIGLFLVGAGTSLPELALSLGAVVKGRTALALGNVIGSNVFDLLVPVGVSALLHPLQVERLTVLVDLPALGVLTLLALAFLARRRHLKRSEALLLIAGYIAYAVVRVSVTGA